MTNERPFPKARPEDVPADGRVCPVPEALAEYLDGVMDAAQRVRIQDHISRCKDCYFVVTETGMMGGPAEQGATAIHSARRSFPGRYILPMAAALLVGLGSAALWRQSPPTDPYAEALRPLVEAVGSRRFLEARLTGGFKDGPVVNARRAGPASGEPDANGLRLGGATGTDEDWAVLAAAARLQSRAKESPSFENDRALAAASLVVGDVEGAIVILSRLRRVAPENPELLSDLAAAYLEGGTRQPERYPLALEAAGQALSRSPNLIEAMSNKALAAEALGLREDARTLWEKISREAPTAEWRAEAAQRARDLAADPPVGARPGYEELDGVLADESLPDREWLARVGEVSSRLAEAFGDTELATLATAPPGADVSSWRALHLLYGKGRRHYARFEFDDAASLLSEFSTRAKGTGSPLLPWAEGWSTIARRFKDPEGASRKLRAIVRRPYTAALLSRCYTALGVIETEQGRYQEALADYDRAMALSLQSQDMRSQLALGAMTSSLFDRLGRRGLAWSAAIGVLAKMDEFEPRLAPSFFQRLAEMSVSQDLPRTAAMFADQARRVGTLADAPSLEWTLARVAGALGDLPRAQAHLLRAAELSAAHPDKSASDKMIAETTLVSLELASRGIDVSMDSAHALRYFASGGGDGREWLARVAEGLARERQGQADAALASFEKATELLEDDSAVAGGWSLANRNLQVPFGRVIEAAFDAGDHWGALARIENLNSLRRNASRRKVDGPALAEAVRRWDEPTAVLVLWPADRRVLRWWVRPGEVTADSVAVSRPQLEGLVDQYAVGDKPKRAEAAARLRELVGPPPSTGPWLVMPLGPFRAVPFVALPEASGVLGDRFAFAVIPTLIPVARKTHRRSNGSLTVIAPGYPEPLPGAADEARRLHLRMPESQLFDGRAATRQVAIKALSQARILHFAGHISYSSSNPERSALWITDVDGRELPLTLADLRAVDLGGMELLFLSACSSVRSSPDLGYASTSLAEQFLDQGATAVVGSLWDIPDGLAAEIVRDFYAAYLQSGDAMEALRSGQRRAMARNQPAAGWASYQVLQLKHTAAS